MLNIWKDYSTQKLGIEGRWVNLNLDVLNYRDVRLITH